MNVYSSDNLKYIVRHYLSKIGLYKRKIMISEDPFIDKESLEFFKTQIKKSEVILEYGSGGSTLFANKLGKEVYSVESDYYFYRKIESLLKTKNNKTQIFFSNIGITGSYGIPIFKYPYKFRLQRWKNYVQKPWLNLKNNKLPDLVFIDGRFRVACFLYSIIKLKSYPKAKIIIDDFASRPEYHVVKQYAKFIGLKGRMGVFTPSNSKINEIKSILSDYYKKWD